ncbi:MAG: hypothetical protein IPH34_06460 [Chitinophagaceae bacterium]|nr:hypothetical protein [Chitinophagaceae bacterium]MBK8311076.1 hypothetical protein [Chitinophagaceae bacterium]MBK8607711.1 hypothetical protein [Chitinophagaceae bacterium]MBP6477964.1 hypothetical protein [Chitinophagaceae bacterium]MBP7107135.1 hypothetical protein [Chitinophagaceae bacterium]
MKSISSLRNQFASPLKIVKTATPKIEEKKTPYLRAILSATPSPVNSEKKINLSTPDLYAALRYIKESALLKR